MDIDDMRYDAEDNNKITKLMSDIRDVLEKDNGNFKEVEKIILRFIDDSHIWVLDSLDMLKTIKDYMDILKEQDSWKGDAGCKK